MLRDNGELSRVEDESEDVPSINMNSIKENEPEMSQRTYLRLIFDIPTQPEFNRRK